MEGQRRSHKMSSENWQAIDAIAKDLNVTASTGRRIGLPSWRSLLYQIATGKLVVVPAAVQDWYTALMVDTIKTVNRLEVNPRSAGAKRHILARLRAAKADSAHDQHDL